MNTPTEGQVPISTEGDIVLARRAVREIATQAGFGTTDVTRIVTASSELARNIFKYAGQGALHWRRLEDGEKRGLELTFIDHGPGIPDVNLALQEGYSTAGGLGLGLPGAQRLMDQMQINSKPGEGTVVTVRKWCKT